MNSYPEDLLPVIKAACVKKRKSKYHQPLSLPSDDVIRAFLDVSYHASFETEEGRRPGFRLILYSPNDHEEAAGRRKPDYEYYQQSFRLILLSKPRPFEVAELKRLAPAAELKRLLVCVQNANPNPTTPCLNMWALLDVGENWWKFLHHESEGGMPPPNFLTLSSTGPGEISISAQGEVLASLKGGRITLPNQGALWSGPLSDFLEKAREELYADATGRLGSKKWDPEGHDDDYPFRCYNFFLERILFHARQRGHGGTIILIPNYLTMADTRLLDRINLKYPCQYNCAWELLLARLVNERRFYDLHFPLWDAKQPCTQDSFQDYVRLSSEREEIQEGLSDVAQAMASLSSVDGAVIMNQHFQVLGFGAEVIATSPSLSTVKAVTIGSDHAEVPVESFGTRHRSAFRFCSSLEDSIAFVLSQDGGVKAVKRHGKDVLLWPDINTGAMGI